MKSDHKHSPFHVNNVYNHVKALLDEPDRRNLEQDKARFLKFSLFIKRKIQQTKVSCHYIMSLFIRSMRHLDYDARYWSKKQEKSAELPEKLTLPNSERQISLVEISTSSRDILGVNKLKDTSRKRSLGRG